MAPAHQQRRRQRLHLPRAGGPAHRFKIGTLPFGPPYIAMLILAPILLVGLSPVPARATGSASAIRAASDDPDAAAARGHPGQADDHAGVGDRRRHRGLLGDPGHPDDRRASPSRPSVPDLLLKGLAGAVIARMSSIPIAVAASIGIGVLEQVLLSNPDTRGLVSVVIGAIDRGRAAAPARRSAAPARTRATWRRVVVPPAARPPTGTLRSIRWMPRVLLAVVTAGRRRPGLRRQQRDRVGAHRGRRVRPRRPERRAAHRHRPASSRSASSPTPASAPPSRSSSSPSTEQLRARRARRRRRRRPLASALVGIPALRLRGLALAVCDAGLRAGDHRLAAAPRHLPRRRRRPGRSRPGSATRSTSRRTTTSSPCSCSRSACGWPATCGAAGSACHCRRCATTRTPARAFTVPEPAPQAAALRRLRRAGRPRRRRHRAQPDLAHRQLVPGLGQHRRRRADRDRWSRL